MRTITTKNNAPISIDDRIMIGVYPSPGVPEGTVVKLGLVRSDTLVEIKEGTENIQGADAAVTQKRDPTLAIRTKDCAPICFGDGKKIGIAHVGWQGFSLGLAEKTLGYFDPAELTVFVGPFLHAFEIQKDQCYEALMKKPGTEKYIREDADGRLIFHFQEALASVLPETALFDTRDTSVDLSLPSHRRDKEAAGFLTTVRFA